MVKFTVPHFHIFFLGQRMPHSCRLSTPVSIYCFDAVRVCSHPFVLFMLLLLMTACDSVCFCKCLSESATDLPYSLSNPPTQLTARRSVQFSSAKLLSHILLCWCKRISFLTLFLTHWPSSKLDTFPARYPPPLLFACWSSKKRIRRRTI